MYWLSSKRNRAEYDKTKMGDEEEARVGGGWHQIPPRPFPHQLNDITELPDDVIGQPHSLGKQQKIHYSVCMCVFLCMCVCMSVRLSACVGSETFVQWCNHRPCGHTDYTLINLLSLHTHPIHTPTHTNTHPHTLITDPEYSPSLFLGMITHSIRPTDSAAQSSFYQMAFK